MNVYWLEQTVDQVPSGIDWLGPTEILHLETLRFPKRRMDWTLGRWTAKCALAIVHDLPFSSDRLSKIEIRVSSSGAPEAFIADRGSDFSLSISHRSGVAMCALACKPIRLGCDLEVIEARSDGFLEDYFTLEEQLLVADFPLADRARLVALLWSAKESALKALQLGLRADTRSLRVDPQITEAAGAWSPLHVRFNDLDSFGGWWREENGLLRTLVADIRHSVLPSPLHVGSNQSAAQRCSYDNTSRQDAM